jgi:O-antigen ligase
MTAGRAVDKRLATLLVPALLVIAAIVLLALIVPGEQYSRMLLGGAVGLVVVVGTFIRPVLGVYLFVATMLTEALFMVGAVSVARLLGMLVLGAWVVHSLAGRRFQIIMPSQAWFAVMFILWGFISVMWALDMQRLSAALLLLAQLMALYIVVINLVNSVRRVQIILAIITAVSLILGLLTIFRVPAVDLVDGRVDLSQISVGDMNAQAAYFLPSAALLMVLFSRRVQLAHKLLLLLALSVIVLAILATASRGAIVSLTIILVLGMMVDHSLWQVALPALLMGSVAVLLLPHTLVERLQSIVTLSDRGAGRLDIWLVALRIIRTHPIFGVGLNSFAKAFDKHVSETPGILRDIGRGRASHNTLLNVQSELGVVGLGLFVIFVGMTLRRGLAAVANWRRVGSHGMTALAVAVWLSVVGMLVTGLFLDVQYWKLFWLLLALPEVMRRLSEQSVQETAAK